MVLAVLGERSELFACHRVVTEGRERCTMEVLLVAVLYLFDCERIVIRGHGDVATVDNFKAIEEWVDGEGDVVPAVKREATRTSANARGTEAGARSI